MVMPDMDGRETFRRLKAVRSDVKVLLSSGYSIDGEMGNLLQEGALGFVQKPYHRNELAQAIMDALGSGLAAGPAPGRG
jgi:two-component system cell cycle sensor histidine kinase/response regulator CckA